MSLGESFEVSKAHTMSPSFSVSLPCGCVSKCKISGMVPVPILTACFYAASHDENELYHLKM